MEKRIEGDESKLAALRQQLADLPPETVKGGGGGCSFSVSPVGKKPTCQW